MRKTWKADKNRYAALAANYATGATTKELADAYGVTQPAVWRMIKKT